MQVLLQYQSKNYYIIGQELYYSIGRFITLSVVTGLKMNIAKTKVTVVDNTPINVNNALIENVQGYV